MADRRKTSAQETSSEARPPVKGGGATADHVQGSSASAAPDYKVGYCQPPLHTRFQKGQPRPARKPKPAAEEGFEDWFEAELRLPMKFVDESGKEQVLPKGKVLAKASVNKALKSGDIRQIKDFIPRRPAKTDNEIATADIELIARFLAHHLPSETLPATNAADEGKIDSGADGEEDDE